MKRYKLSWLFCILAFMASSCVSTEKTMAQPGAMVSFQTFYDELSPYGRWINDPEYGYVWAPDVEPGFQPYATRGYWVMTQYGNTWVSDYNWGWAAFHYGRWMYDDYYGWLWVPGNEWGPAWVAWRSGGGYYGWAPLGPGININVSFNIPAARWCYVPYRYITYPRVYSYCVPRTRIVHVHQQTTIINNYYTNNNQTYVYGPRSQDIEKHTRNRVRVYQVDNDSRPGRTVVQNNSVRVYRPEVSSQKSATPGNVYSRGSNPRSTPQTGSSFAEKNEARERNNVSERNTSGQRNSSTYESNRGNTINRSSDRNAPNQERVEQARPQIAPRSRESMESTGRSQQQQMNQRAASPDRQPAPSNRYSQSPAAERESVQPRTQRSQEQYQPRRQETTPRQQPQQTQPQRQQSQPQMRTPRQQPQAQPQRQEQRQSQAQPSQRSESPRSSNGSVRPRRE